MDDSIVGDVQFDFCQTSEMLEHISHLDIEVVELAVVLFVEGSGPVRADDEVLIHRHLQSTAS